MQFTNRYCLKPDLIFVLVHKKVPYTLYVQAYKQNGNFIQKVPLFRCHRCTTSSDFSLNLHLAPTKICLSLQFPSCFVYDTTLHLDSIKYNAWFELQHGPSMIVQRVKQKLYRLQPLNVEFLQDILPLVLREQGVHSKNKRLRYSVISLLLQLSTCWRITTHGNWSVQNFDTRVVDKQSNGQQTCSSVL